MWSPQTAVSWLNYDHTQLGIYIILSFQMRTIPFCLPISFLNVSPSSVPLFPTSRPPKSQIVWFFISARHACRHFILLFPLLGFKHFFQWTQNILFCICVHDSDDYDCVILTLPYVKYHQTFQPFYIFQWGKLKPPTFHRSLILIIMMTFSDLIAIPKWGYC